MIEKVKGATQAERGGFFGFTFPNQPKVVYGDRINRLDTQRPGNESDDMPKLISLLVLALSSCWF